MSFLLDIDRSSSVLKLLFGFIRDEVCDEEAEHSFEEALAEIFQGASLPLESLEKVRTIFEQTKDECPEFLDTVRRVAKDFRDQKEVLVYLIRILLRVAVDDGVFYRRDKERIAEVLREFDLSFADLKTLSSEELRLLGYMSSEDTVEELCSEDLMQHYQVLGCPPGSSDQELRHAYRSLAKQYHPDRVIEDEAHIARKHFEKVQTAFESIQRARQLG